MSLFFISLAAFVVSLTTFFSGFGLGTVLTPVFAIWFPIELAVGLTAIVHLLNNLFKLALVGRWASWPTVLRFGGPAMLAAVLGAWLLAGISDLEPLMGYQLAGRSYQVQPIKLLLAILIIAFTLLEWLPKFKNWSVDQKYLPVGGLLSGFFGGLSGHQGALRSAFLLRTGLAKESYIATGVIIACIVDVIRLSVYFQKFNHEHITDNYLVLSVATLAAFLGAYLGSQLLKKVTMAVVQNIVSVGLIVLALALGAGVI